MKNLYEVESPGTTWILYEYLPRPQVGRCRTVTERCRTEREAYRLLSGTEATVPTVVEATPSCLLVEQIGGESAGTLLENGNFDRSHAHQLGEALAKVHTVSRSQYGELYGEPTTDAWQAHLRRLVDITKRRADSDPLVAAGISYLESSLDSLGPATEPVLLHGDYHPWNVILTDRDTVVLDMEASFAGPPEYDVSKALVEWVTPSNVTDAFLEGYGEKSLLDKPDRFRFYRVFHSVVGILDGRRVDSEELVQSYQRTLADALSN